MSPLRIARENRFSMYHLTFFICHRQNQRLSRSCSKPVLLKEQTMIPAQFNYEAPTTLDEALSLLAANPDDAKILAGGHSLIPAMKLRLAQPALLVDIGRINDLAYIREEGDRILIGAMTTHYQLESSTRLQEICPLLPACASQI